ncbi:MAG: PDZ domain-containing protein [Acidobacteriota bacterium]|nr:PDZ domain-containing protein [Acidobacteriota bacterium]
MPKLSKILLLTTSVLFVLAIFLGVNSSGVSAASEEDNAYRQINVYSEVLRHIQSDYVVDPNISKVTNGALRGLLESLDADSSYLTPDEYKLYKAGQAGKAQVGLSVSKRFGYATVVTVFPGSPADKAGLADGDIIEAVGSQDTRELSLAMIDFLLAGEPGSTLTLSVVRPRKATPDKIVMTRVLPSAPPVIETMLENGSILELRPLTLDHEHVQQMEQKLKAASRSGNKKVILDLRDVAVGDMSEAVRAANFFLASGTIAALEGQKVARQTFTAEASKAIDTTGPIVVLTNRGTAGPGELLAAALQDNHRAELVGEKTFGEGTQQRTFDLPDGSALILSVAKYESPAGKKFEDEGVTPSVLVASTPEDADAADDDDSAATTAAAPAAKPTVTVDEQLNKALDILRSKPA